MDADGDVDPEDFALFLKCLSDRGLKREHGATELVPRAAACIWLTENRTARRGLAVAVRLSCQTSLSSLLTLVVWQLCRFWRQATDRTGNRSSCEYARGSNPLV
jgi:hypothetical protein